MGDEVFRLELSADEALVLFEFLSRYGDDGRLDIVDQAEQAVLWGLQCSLEARLVEPFLADYQERLSEARGRLRHETD